MLFKVLSFVALFAIASAKPAGQEDTFEAHPKYTFSYDVQDADTGDFKSQTETRDGDLVQGQYSLIDADGYRRVVQYSADAERGFSASVRREPLANPSAFVAPKPAVLLKSPPVSSPKFQHIKALPVLKPFAQPAFIRSYAAPTLIHHAPTHTLVHAGAVHLTPTAHIVHTAPAPRLIVHHAPHTISYVH